MGQNDIKVRFEEEESKSENTDGKKILVHLLYVLLDLFVFNSAVKHPLQMWGKTRILIKTNIMLWNIKSKQGDENMHLLFPISQI